LCVGSGSGDNKKYDEQDGSWHRKIIFMQYFAAI